MLLEQRQHLFAYKSVVGLLFVKIKAEPSDDSDRVPLSLVFPFDDGEIGTFVGCLSQQNLNVVRMPVVVSVAFGDHDGCGVGKHYFRKDLIC